MNKNEQKVQQLQRLVIKEEFFMLTGDHFSAALLNDMIFWQGITNKSDKKILNLIAQLEKKKGSNNEKRIQDLKKKYRDGWFYKTGEDWLIEVMNWNSVSTITRRIQSFVDKGWVEKGDNPDPKNKWDRTKWYRVDLDKIAKDLQELGYSLEGYTLLPEEEEQIDEKDENTGESASSCILHSEKSNLHDEKSNLHSEESSLHNDGTIPESINHKELSERNNIKNLSIHVEDIENSNLSSTIKDALKTEIDRLRYHDISISDILNNYELHKNQIDDVIYKDALIFSLNHDKKIKNLNNIMSTNVNTQVEWNNQRANAPKRSDKTSYRPVRKEMIPDHIDLQVKEDNQDIVVDDEKLAETMAWLKALREEEQLQQGA